MPIDGIKKIRKIVHHNKPFPGPVSWGIDAVRPRKYKHISHQISKKTFWSDWSLMESLGEIKSYLFNKRVVFSGLGIILIVAIMSISVSSYNFVSQNYDFLKLFKDGKYLILFQNNTEMRASGGFIGSFATVETKNGLIKDFYFDTNIYKRDSKFSKTNKVDVPDPAWLKLISQGDWNMRDSNWAVDFPEAAQQVAWFYEQEEGTPVDGVLTINATTMVDLLNLIGPIEMPEYNTTVTSDNFLSMIQYKIEKEYFQDETNKVTNEPKTILKDLLPKIFSKINERRYYGLVMDLAKKELQEKQAMFYFYDGSKEKIAQTNSWTGDVKQPDGDYLYINNSNLGANKSSLKVKEGIKLNSSIGEQGSVINTLTITRTHSGNYDWPDGENKNYMRILVPYGAKLISAKMDEIGYLNNIDVKKEAGKTVFGLWVNTLPGTSHIFNITYELPFKTNENNYSLLVQKQSGNLGDDLQTLVNGKIKFDGMLNVDREIK